MTTTENKPSNIIGIPTFNSYEQFEKNSIKANLNGNEACPCCGKELINPQYFINSIYGGEMYPANDKNEYNDAWIIGVGSECRKKLPKEYVFQK